MSGTHHGVVVPPGQSAPFATISPTDHAAWIIIAAWLSISMVLVFSAIHVLIRQTNGFGYKSAYDYLLGLSTVFVVIYSIVILVACWEGLGKSMTLLDPAQLQSIQKLYYASTLLYVVPIAASKAAVACFVICLTPVESQTKYIKGLTAFVTLWGLALLFSSALTCNLSHPWILIGEHQKCAGYFVRDQVLESLGAAYEAAVFGSAVWLVWNLQMGWEKKAMVISSFSFRLLLIVITALRLASASETDLTTDPTLLLAKFITWTSAELSYSVVSGTIMILRPLVANLGTHYGRGHGAGGDTSGSHSMSFGHNATSQTRSKTRLSTAGRSDAYPMTSMTRSKGWDVLEEIDEVPAPAGPGTYSYAIGSGEADRKSLNSDSSQKVMVRRDVTWSTDKA